MCNNRYKVLMIESDNALRSFLETVLEEKGYQVQSVETGGQGLCSFSNRRPDMILLDPELPDTDGKQIIRRIRGEGHTTPILVLSECGAEETIIEILDLGANDYIRKPFGLGELLARIRACLRSSLWKREVGNLCAGRKVLGDLEIQLDRRRVLSAGQQIQLTQTEYNILALLAQQAGTVMSYEEIAKEVWGSFEAGDVKKLQVNLANIRKKLGENRKYIHNETGIGYQLRAEKE